jgi:hypothetical protein
METVDQKHWTALKAALVKEVRSIFYSMGQVVLIEPSQGSDAELMLCHRSSTLKVTLIAEGNEVLWQTEKESGRGYLSEPVAPLAATLVSRILV